MQQLSSTDALFLHSELDGLPQHIGGISIYDQSTADGGLVRFKDILKLLESRLHLSPIFTRKLANVPMGLDQPYWVEDPNFNLEYHVRHIALPAPGDWRQLCILASRIHSQPLSRAKPMWEMYVIEGLDGIEGIPKGCFGVLIKVHHAAMDGATGSLFSMMMHDLTSEITVPDKAPPRQVEKVSDFSLLQSALKNNLRTPGKVFDVLKQSGSVYKRIQDGIKRKDFETLDDKQATRFQGKISRHRVVDAVKFDFDEIRSIKNSVDSATVNDVMLTIVAGGLRRYLASKNELPEETLVTGCPIDVRSEEERTAGGNMIGFMNVSLCSDIADPLERLNTIKKASKGSKAYADALGPRIIMDITDMIPGGILSAAIRTAAATGLSEANVIQNTIVTNVPGPPFQLYFAGAKLVDSISFGPLLPNVGLFHIVYSAVQNKKGRVNLSFTACRDMMPDPAFYAQCLQESFDELKAATELKPAAKKKSRAKKKRPSTKAAAKKK